MKLLIIGAGAIGATVGAHMARAGHDITLCDNDAAHVAAINQDGVIIEGPVENFSIKIPAITPDQLPDSIENVAISVKSHHTESVAKSLVGKVHENSTIITLQNGMTAEILEKYFDPTLLVTAFVNFGADVMGPGRIMQGNAATVRIGEWARPDITERLTQLASAIPYAQATANIKGFLWSKEAYGAMLFAGAVSDLSIADSLSDPEFRPLMLAVAREVLAQSPVKPESFDGFDPEDLEGSLDRLVEFNRKSAKSHSGIYRDLMVRKRKTEVGELINSLKGELTFHIGKMIESIERGERTCERANLSLLATYERSIRLGRPLNALVNLIPAPLRASDGPLHGLAIAVKDIVDIAGEIRGNGNPNCQKNPQAHKDAPFIAELRAAGADIFATTNLLEYAAGALNPAIPEAMNPYNPGRTAGGSSSGSASLVGVGGCTLAVGTDTGGSIRLPAHYCAVVGYKPTYNLLSLEGVTPLSPSFDHLGFLSDNMSTLKKAMQCFITESSINHAKTINQLIIGYVPAHFSHPALEENVKTATLNVMELLKSKGAKFVEVDATAFNELERQFGTILLYEAWQVHGEQMKRDPNFYGPETARLFELAQDVSESDYVAAVKTRNELLPKAREIYDGIDLLLTPAAPYVAPPTTPPIDTPEGEVEGLYTGIFNNTGDPAIVIPASLDADGLPIGVQFASAFGEDAQLLHDVTLIESAIGFTPKNFG